MDGLASKDGEGGNRVVTHLKHYGIQNLWNGLPW